MNSHLTKKFFPHMSPWIWKLRSGTCSTTSTCITCLFTSNEENSTCLAKVLWQLSQITNVTWLAQYEATVSSYSFFLWPIPVLLKFFSCPFQGKLYFIVGFCQLPNAQYTRDHTQTLGWYAFFCTKTENLQIEDSAVFPFRLLCD